MKRICPSCFQDQLESEVCRKCGHRMEQDQLPYTLKPGTILNERYIMGIVLGRGGFGITYKAFDVETQRICAIKEFYPKYIGMARIDGETVRVLNLSEQSKFEQGKRRFVEEADTLFHIQRYPYIVPIYNRFEENNTYYYVMKYVDGMNLRKYVLGKRHIYPVNEAVNVVARLGSTLQSVYEREGLIHRDISPENIMIDREGEYTLIDFGSAKSVRRRQDYSIVLKRGFAPPEQYSETTPQGSYTDVFALAGTFYFMVTGKMVANSEERLDKPEIYIPLEKTGISVEENISKAVDHALMLNYKERTQTIQDFLNELMPDTQGRMRDTVGIVEVVQGVLKGTKWVLHGNDRPCVVGRDKACSVIIPNPMVSRKHFTIHYDSSKRMFTGKDHSRNGIYIDAQYCCNQEFIVEAGCLIQFPETDSVLYLGVENG